MFSSMYVHRKKVAMMLLFVFTLQITVPAMAYAAPPPEGNTPVSDPLSQYVNPFTGDFSYNVPLFSIPGPNGESFPLSLNYQGGVRMNQDASWIGLGWELNTGEISRSVNGVADDWKTRAVTTTEIYKQHPFDGTETRMKRDTFNYFGPVYYKDYPTQTLNNTSYRNYTMDIYQSSRMSSKVPFEFPDYDDYYVSGPGIGGKMSPRLFDYAYLMSKNQHIDWIGNVYENMNYSYHDHAALGANSSFKPFTKPVQFVFEQELSRNPSFVKDLWPLQVSHTNAILNTYVPGIENGSFENIGGNGLMPAGNFVQYFTNAQINGYTALKPKHFLDFRARGSSGSLNQRSSGPFPADGIGAFQVTTPDGMTYHYSLPVYTYSQESYNFIFTNPAYASNMKPYETVDVNNTFNHAKKPERYATSWKLTAITGADFKDSNDNGIADEGDTGYWIALDYGKWSDGFEWKFPFYNFTTSSIFQRFLPTMQRASQRLISSHDSRYYREGSIVNGTDEVYYLNTVKTATHTAFFIKDVRSDAHSVPNPAASNKPIPKLHLSHIVLVKNTDLSPSNNPETASALFTMDAAFTSTGIFPANVIHEGKYAAVKTALDAISLKSIDLKKDYSLCKGQFNNIKSSFTKTTRNPVYSYKDNGSSYTYSGLTYQTVQPLASFDPDDKASGKLTLLEVSVLEKGHAQVMPSYLFDYDQNSALKNGNYNPDGQDFWGYYKSDFNADRRGHYTTKTSKDHTDSWSLKKITSPLGGEMKITYESDEYTRVGFDGNEDALSYFMPQRMFLIYDIRSTNGNATFKGHFLDKDAHEFVHTNADRYVNAQGYSHNVKVPILKNNAPYDLLNVNLPGYSGYNHLTGTSPGSVSYDSVNRELLFTPSSNVILSASDSVTYEGNGYVFVTMKKAYGGGVRVKSIGLKDNQSGDEYKTEFNYEEGVATTEPDWFSAIRGPVFELKRSSTGSERHAVSPNVGYSRVTVRNKSLSNTYEGATTYRFHNYTESFFPLRVHDEALTYPDAHSTTSNRDEILVVSDGRNTLYGLTDSVIVYDQFQNAIQVTKNEYQDPAAAEGRRTEEVFFRYYQKDYLDRTRTSGGYSWQYVDINRIAMAKRHYVTQLKRQTVIQGGVKQVTEYQEWDALSGTPTKWVSYDGSAGAKVITQKPAYHTYAGMGPKTADSSNLNMLSPVAHTRLQKGPLNYDEKFGFNSQADLTLTAGGHTNWANTYAMRSYDAGNSRYITSSQPGLWKSTQSYVFNGDTSVANWKLNAENTLFDRKGNLLEIKSGKNYAALKWQSDNRKLAEVAGANYAGFTFSSFEDTIRPNPSSGSVYHYSGEIAGSATWQKASSAGITAHTGQYVAKVSTGETGPVYKITVDNTGSGSTLMHRGVEYGRTYTASVWVHKNSPADAGIRISFNGKRGSSTLVSLSDEQNNGSGTDTLTVGDWRLLKVSITLPNDGSLATPLSGDGLVVTLKSPAGANQTAYYDDLMLRPADASLTGYVYDPQTGLNTAVINNDGLATFFMYDAAGRVIRVKKETAQGVKLVSETKYNFSR
jgi:hypothetical protein